LTTGSIHEDLGGVVEQKQRHAQMRDGGRLNQTSDLLKLVHDNYDAVSIADLSGPYDADVGGYRP